MPYSHWNSATLGIPHLAVHLSSRAKLMMIQVPHRAGHGERAIMPRLLKSSSFICIVRVHFLGTVSGWTIGRR
jgi:hypothetical protein